MSSNGVDIQAGRESDPIRHPLVEMLVIGAPTVVTMTSYTVMQFIDGMMVSRIGPEPVYVAAQGNGGMLVWIAMATMLGLLSVVNSFVSQNLGAGTPRRGAAYAWNGMWLAGAASILFIPYALALGPIFRSVHSDPELVRLETAYANVLMAGAFLTMASRGLANYFFGMHKPGVVMVAVVSGNLVNVCCNAVLIFGAAGPPKGTPFAGVFQSIAQGIGMDEGMGVTGAALGTVIGTAFELALPFAVFVGRRWDEKYHTRAVWRPGAKPIKDLLRVGWPAGLMMGNELICWGMLMAVLIPQAGAAQVATTSELTGEALRAAQSAEGVIQNTAGWIALRYMHVAFMPAIGLSIAVSAMVGRAMGMGRPDLAAARAWLGLKVTLAYMGVCALAFVIFREQMINVFIPPDMSQVERDAVLRVGAKVMIAAAVFQLFDAMAITMSAALRGAGDTLWPGLATIVFSWSLIVGGGYLLIWLAPGIGSIGPWIGASAYIIALGIAMTVRFMGGSWKQIRLAEPTEPGQVLRAELSEEAVAGTTPGAA